MTVSSMPRTLSTDPHAVYMREYRAKKGKPLADWQAAYYAEYRKRKAAEIRAQQAGYRAANKEHIAARKAEYQAATKEQKAAYDREYRIKNRGRISAWMKAYWRANPELKATHDRNSKARRRGAVGRYKHTDITALMSAQRGQCAYCEADILGTFHVDHRQPVSKGGTNWPDNLQLTCELCNLSKHDMTHEDFLQSARYKAIIERRSCGSTG